MRKAVHGQHGRLAVLLVTLALLAAPAFADPLPSWMQPGSQPGHSSPTPHRKTEPAEPAQHHARKEAGPTLGGLPELSNATLNLLGFILGWPLFGLLVLFITRRARLALKIGLLPLLWSLPLPLMERLGLPTWSGALVFFGGLWWSWRWPLWRGLPGRRTAPTATHGSASWGSSADAIARGHLHKAGLVQAGTYGFALGRATDAPRDYDPRWRAAGHVLTIAPTGAGKGVSAVIPALLEYPGSTVVLDLKGENYAVTASARRAMGHVVYLVDPFGVTGDPTHGFNPLSRLDPNHPDAVGDAAALADMLVLAGGRGEDAHFDDTARDLLQGLAIHVASLPDPERRHLGELRRLLTASEDELFGTFADMAVDPQAGFGVPARVVNTVMGTGDRERGSILSTARRHTAFLDDPRIVAALSRQDVPLGELKAQPMTVYLVLPPARLTANTRFVRAFIGMTLAGVTASSAKPLWPVLFLLDEFAQLGHLRQIEDAISLVRGYGAAFWLLVQDLSQLKATYPKWQTFMANTTRQFFGTADFDTAKLVSDSIGQATISYRTGNTSQQLGQRQISSSSGTGEHLTSRPLLTPDEVTRLPPHLSLVFSRGEAPYALHRLNYLNDADYAGRFSANPYHV